MWLRVLFNIGKFIALARSIEHLIRDLKNGNGYKSGLLEILSIAQDLLIAKVIDIPNVDEDQLAKTIEEVKGQIA